VRDKSTAAGCHSRQEGIMGSFFKQNGIKIFLGLVVVYLLFIMDLGDHTFAGHAVRILKTPESRELGDEIVDKVVTLATGAKHRAMAALDRD
jgi:hypothetical protein